MQGSIQPGMMVAVDVAPHAGRAIEIVIPFGVNQEDAFTPLNEQWFVLLHLREGMPDMFSIPLPQGVEVGCSDAVIRGHAEEFGNEARARKRLKPG